MSDLKAIKDEPPEGCSASPHSEENLFVWSATIFGPDETPWEGGIFGLRLIFGENYPEKPPRVRFTSDIFHPNGKCQRFRIADLNYHVNDLDFCDKASNWNFLIQYIRIDCRIEVYFLWDLVNYKTNFLGSRI